MKAVLKGEGLVRNAALVIASVALFSWVAWAQTSGSDAKSQELSSAAQTMHEMESSGKIPKKLLDEAQCVAVIPDLTKAGLIAGGEHGTGVVSCRTSQGWSAPAFISMSGGSFGLQAGAEHSQIVLVMNKQGEQEFMSGKLKMGAGVSAAGPTADSYNESTGWGAPILSYTRSNGAYAGADIQGSKISVDSDAMKDVYGSHESERNVLNGQVQVPQQAQPFVSALPASGMGH